MTDQDGNGDRAEKRYVIVDHDGVSVEVDDGRDGDLQLMIDVELYALPVGGRFTVTRVA